MTMTDRALDLLRSAPHQTFTLTELRVFAGVSLRAQYRLRELLLASGQAERVPGGFRYVEPEPPVEFFNVDDDGYEDRF